MTIYCNGSLPFFGYSMIWRPFPVGSPVWLHYLVIDLFLYLTPVYLVVGTLGNLLSITVFLRPAMSTLASRSRFILISIMDVIILYGCMFVVFLDFGNFHRFCDLQFVYINIWIQSSLMMMDVWILALVTLERTLAIFRPLSTWTGNDNRKKCCSWINGSLIALPFVCFFLCLPQLFRPILQMTILFQFSDIITIINTILSTIFPFILMLCLDIAILIKLYGSPFSGLKKEKGKNGWMSRKKRRAIKKKTNSPLVSFNDVDTGGEATQDKITKTKRTSIKKTGNSYVTSGRMSARSRALQSVKMILVVDIVAILLSMPMILLLIFRTNNIALVYAARFAIYTRHALNFIFYFISSQFRRETIAVLCRHFRRPVSSGASTKLSTITSTVNM